MEVALKGLKVVEMGHVIAGPFCGGMLGDFGAEVIKIETPGAGDGLRSMGRYKDMHFALEGRNKKCITLNLKTEKGKEILSSILEKTDILIENYRPGVLAKLGFSWEKLQKINKRLILVSVSGYGQTGPYRLKPGYDSVGMAMGGLTYVTGFKDGAPTRPGYIIGDYVTGLFAVVGAMFALHARSVYGVGQIVDVSLYESIFRISDTMTSEYAYDGTIKGRIGNAHLATVPSGNFKTKDDKWLVLSVGNDKVFCEFAKCVERLELLENPLLDTQLNRVKQREYLEDIAKDFVLNHTLEENLNIFNGKVPAAPVYTIEDIFNDPQYAARENIIEIDDERFGNMKMQNIFPRLSATPGKVKWTGPSIGKNNNEVYEKLLGFSEEEIEKLKIEGII